MIPRENDPHVFFKADKAFDGVTHKLVSLSNEAIAIFKRSQYYASE